MATFPSAGYAVSGWPQLQTYIDAGDAQDGVSIGNSNGSDDTATINSLLTTYAGGLVLGVRGQNYIISSPLIMRSNTTLDLSGCTLTLKAGSNSGMVRNYSWLNPAATAADAAITAGSNVVTTSLGASAVVGQSVTIAGAGASTAGTPAASGVLTGIVAAKTSTTITLNNLTSEALAAGLTVSSAAISLFNRDNNIEFLAAKVDRGSNAGSGTTQDVHSVAFRGVDRVSVTIKQAVSLAGKYMVRFSDCRDFYADVLGLNTFSDGVHINGPCANGWIPRVAGVHGDDLIAFTTNDYTNDSDTSGEIRGVEVGYLRSEGGLAHQVLMAAGPGGIIRDVHFGGIYGHAAAGVFLGGTASTDIGTYTDIDLGTIHPDNAQTATPLAIGTGVMNRIKGRVVWQPLSTTSQSAVLIGVAGAGALTTLATLELQLSLGTNAANGVLMTSANVTIEHMVLDKPVGTPGLASTQSLVSLGSGGTVRRLTVRDGSWTCSAFTSNMLVILGAVDEIEIENLYANVLTNSNIVLLNNAAAAVATCTFDNPRVDWSGGSGALYRAASGASGTVIVRGGKTNQGGSLYQDVSGVTGTQLLVLDGLDAASPSRIVDTRATGGLTVHVKALKCTTPLNGMFFASGGAITLEGAPLDSTATLLQRAAAEVLKVKAPFMKTDVALLTPDDGDTCINTNAASGPLVATQVTYDGTNSKWRGTRGFLVAGTATLVAGTVTVSDAKITASSNIRVTTRTPGGTQGAVFVSALTAATSFTLKSTSASDTSVVYYEIVSYV